jgi:hypothetical protein
MKAIDERWPTAHKPYAVGTANRNVCAQQDLEWLSLSLRSRERQIAAVGAP